MSVLRWGNLAVAILAGAAANVAGVLYAENEPRTAWGPWAYVVGAWVTSALAATAWLPVRWRAWPLAVGALASAAWFIVMLPFLFMNLAGHFLATVFFAATAWEEWPVSDGRSIKS